MSISVPGTTYLVGGNVRDALLGRAVQDRDWVVVGATPEEMLRAGFKPVGADFPVFLHPETKDEYALARTERKSGRGYLGFTIYASPEVTIEEDLARRDLTINAIAQTADGALVDPFHGRIDLQNKVLRHVSAAFAEDPLRVLRLARFAARLDGFTVAEETLALARSLRDELTTLTPERVWQEISRGLNEAAPQRMFEVLIACDAWPQIASFVPTAQLAHVGAVVRALPRETPMRYAALALACEDALLADALAQHWKVPRECSELAQTARLGVNALPRYAAMTAEDKVDFFTRVDAFRRSERFAQALRVACGWSGDVRSEAVIQNDWRAANAVNAGEIASNVPTAQVKAAVRAARARAISQTFAA
jgi:tRNA nucleotidyltransferase (CCA-adding enzyme)